MSGGLLVCITQYCQIKQLVFENNFALSTQNCSQYQSVLSLIVKTWGLLPAFLSQLQFFNFILLHFSAVTFYL